MADHRRMTSRHSNALLAIVVGGGIAGAADLVAACISEGWWRTPLAVSAGLLGRQAMHGGTSVWLLGVCLHFLIAISAATIYYLASRPLQFLRNYPIICGLSFGIDVQLFMNLVVLPLSALHVKGPFSLQDMIVGLFLHMMLIGLPISFSVYFFTASER